MIKIFAPFSPQLFFLLVGVLEFIKVMLEGEAFVLCLGSRREWLDKNPSNTKPIGSIDYVCNYWVHELQNQITWQLHLVNVHLQFYVPLCSTHIHTHTPSHRFGYNISG